MPKTRARISEHLRRRVKVSSTVTNQSSSTLSLPSITTFTKQFYGSINAPNQYPPSLQRRRYTQQPLLKTNADRFNSRGRTIYNAFDCLSMEHQGQSSRLRLMHTSHRNIPKGALSLSSSHSFAGVETAAKYSEWTLAVVDPFQTDEDANILQQADLLFEMYIRME